LKNFGQGTGCKMKKAGTNVPALQLIKNVQLRAAGFLAA
jgi:hypothetical protein